MLNPTSTTPPAESWAEVRAHNQVMRYRRAGSGRSTLLLRPEANAGALWPELTVSLRTSFRVIEPVVPRLVSDAAAWLTDFLDGLGLEQVALVAADELILPALELALLDPERVARLVFVPVDRDGTGRLDLVLASSARGLAAPLLVSPRDTRSGDAVRRVTDFLGGEWVATPG